MFVKTFLLVHVVLSSTLASKKETLNLSETSNMNGNFMRNIVARSHLPEVETKDIDFRHEGNVNALERQVTIGGSKEQLVHMQHKKRNLASLIFTGVSTGISVVGLGLSLAQTLSKGCFYYPSICKNKKKMEDLERRLIPMQSEYKKLYLDNKKEFIDILTSNSNNAYISYYVNDTMQNIYTLEELESFLSAKLESQFTKLYAKYKNAKTSEEYLDNVVGQLEYRISDIHNMLEGVKNTMLKPVLVVSLVVPVVVNFVTTFKQVKKQVHFNKVKSLYKKIGIMTKTADATMKRKGYESIVTTMQTNKITKYGSKLSATKKAQLKTSLSQLSRAQIKTVYGKMMKHRNGKTPKAPKLSKTDIGMGVIGIVSEIVSHYLSINEWSKTANDVEEATKKYVKHYEKFKNQLDILRNETVELNEIWPDVISSFNRSTLFFQTLIDSAKNYTSFNGAVGSPKLPMNTSDPIFDIDFMTINRNNIQSAQEKVLSFAKDVDNDILRLKDKMYARKTLYENVLLMTNSYNTIDQMFKSITGHFEFSQSEIVKTFGKSLTKKDLTCTIALLRLDLQVYDFFPLGILRPKCNLSIDIYNQKEQISNTKRNEYYLNEIIIKTLNSNKSAPALSDLMALVKNAFSAKDNAKMTLYGDSLTEKDVVCAIAKQFPSKQEYDFISLAPFRSDCGKVDEKIFQKMKTDAGVMKNANSQITAYMNACEYFNWCLCPVMMEKHLKITFNQVVNLIRLHVDPKKKTYCGNKDCDCVKL